MDIRVIIAALVIVFLLGAGLYKLDEGDRLKLSQVQEGKLTLSCTFKDGERVVPPEKVTDYHEGRWYFIEEGSAVKCTLF